ncbi:hypothetical protein MCOR16_009018 [Pyricularia oryzae]|nr:hypothetical protein MCOR15_010569 [Pyricularia oryzae]KAI6518392.1 hypothetical protein MCOR16_009018 [Pyricularia oryzae]
MDGEGMLTHGPGGLSDILEDWDHSRGKRPHVLHTIPTGQNRTSGVLSLSRRREIYKLCSQFDIVLIEDNPYFNLYYPPSAGGETFDGASFPYGLFNELVLSFLRLDTEGRVIRLDSFSKSIAPGCRLGWIMASDGPNSGGKW